MLAGAVVPAGAGAMMDVPLQSGVTIGIADQKPNMFVDPRFVALGIRHARLAVGWDVLTNRRTAAELETWLAHAQATGVEPLISFMHSRGTNRRATPTPARLQYEFRRLRQLYPWVTTYATWNEANHCGEPLCHRPKTAAAYYRVLRRECPTCTILAPEMLDMPGMGRWVRQFRAPPGLHAAAVGPAQLRRGQPLQDLAPARAPARDARRGDLADGGGRPRAARQQQPHGDPGGSAPRR